MQRLATLVSVTALGIGVAVLLATVPGQAADADVIDATSFRCITSMTPVRHSYVDNLRGDLAAIVAASNSPTGAVYPPGSVIQLIPGEATVKRDRGASTRRRVTGSSSSSTSPRTARRYASEASRTWSIDSAAIASPVISRPVLSGTWCARATTAAPRSLLLAQ